MALYTTRVVSSGEEIGFRDHFKRSKTPDLSWLPNKNLKIKESIKKQSQ